ncbi:MAG: DUF6362 family protein, partial [Candidatus Binataceae bacterium]
AWDTLRRVPAHGVPSYRTAWPDFVQDFWEAYTVDAPRVRLPPASPRAIDRMHEVFGWFRFVQDRDLTQALWACCGCGMGPRRAGYVLGCSRFTVARRRDEALQSIVAGLKAANALQPNAPFATSVAAR